MNWIILFGLRLISLVMSSYIAKHKILKSSHPLLTQSIPFTAILTFKTNFSTFISFSDSKIEPNLWLRNKS